MREERCIIEGNTIAKNEKEKQTYNSTQDTT